MILVSGNGSGGTTTISTGNALRLDRDLRALGIDLDEEFSRTCSARSRLCRPQEKWRPLTRNFFAISREMKLEPQAHAQDGRPRALPQLRPLRVGLPARDQMGQPAAPGPGAAKRRPAADRAIGPSGSSTNKAAPAGCWPGMALRKKWFPADLVVVAAGGLGTPQVLQDSGIACEATLFVDPVLCVAAEMEGCFQNRELPMPFAVQGNGYIISPYFDHLSFFFNREWRQKAGNIYSLMIKLADDNQGSIARRPHPKKR